MFDDASEFDVSSFDDSDVLNWFHEDGHRTTGIMLN